MHLYIDVCIACSCFQQSEKDTVPIASISHTTRNLGLQAPGQNASKSPLPVRLITEQGSEDSYGPSMILGLGVTFSVSPTVAAIVS